MQGGQVPAAGGCTRAKLCQDTAAAGGEVQVLLHAVVPCGKCTPVQFVVTGAILQCLHLYMAQLNESH